MNRTNVKWSNTSFTNVDCDAKGTYVDAFYTEFSLHDSVDLLYLGSISHSNIILAGRCHIKNGYCNYSALHQCTTWGTSASDSKNVSSTLQLDIPVNYDTHKYFLKFPMDLLTTYASTTKPYIEFTVVKPLILRLRKLVVGTLLPESFQINTFRRTFIVPLTFLPPMSHMLSEVPPPLNPWKSPS